MKGLKSSGSSPRYSTTFAGTFRAWLESPWSCSERISKAQANLPPPLQLLTFHLSPAASSRPLKTSTSSNKIARLQLHWYRRYKHGSRSATSSVYHKIGPVAVAEKIHGKVLRCGNLLIVGKEVQFEHCPNTSFSAVETIKRDRLSN
jgi:hypothetical protein